MFPLQPPHAPRLKEGLQIVTGESTLIIRSRVALIDFDERLSVYCSPHLHASPPPPHPRYPCSCSCQLCVLGCDGFMFISRPWRVLTLGENGGGRWNYGEDRLPGSNPKRHHEISFNSFVDCRPHSQSVSQYRVSRASYRPLTAELNVHYKRIGTLFQFFQASIMLEPTCLLVRQLQSTTQQLQS